MALERMGVKPFETEVYGDASVSPPRDSRRGNRRRAMARRKSTPKEWKLPTSLVVKIGVCVAACGLMLALKELDAPVAAQMVNGVRTAVNEETEMDDLFGKLHFVELPNALEVFSNESRMAIPVSAPQVLLEEEAQYVLWEGAPNAEVSAAAAGQVRAIGEDDILGPYVRLLHANDLETIYYGLADIRVEEGQPIRRYDTLGSLGEGGTLRMHVMLAGQLQPPDEYIDLVDMG